MALVWGAQNALRQPVWNRLDEGDHWIIAHDLATKGTLSNPHGPPAMPASLPRWPVPNNIEALQPPLNYLALVPVDWLASGVLVRVPLFRGSRASPRSPEMVSVLAMRLMNPVFFALTVLVLALTAGLISPGNPVMLWGLPATAFFWRGFVMDTSHVENDVLTGLLATLALYLWFRWRDRLEAKRAVAIGAVVGLSVLAKYSGAYVLVPLGLLATAAWWNGGRSIRGLRQTLVSLLWIAAGGAAIFVPWALVSLNLRGTITGSEIYHALLPSFYWIHHPGLPELADWTVGNLHNVVYGQPGDTVRPGGALVDPILPWIIATLAVAGLGALLIHPSRRFNLSRIEGAALVISIPAMLGVLWLLTLGAGINLVDVGRYDLPAILPTGLLLASGPALLTPRRVQWPVAALLLAGALAIAYQDIVLVAQTFPHFA
jgi:4-amino-4-deoxy-L-arabinose transferase-like glycosyltransferase